MSTYPGNVTLSNAVKERVVSTFQQALTLFKQGRADEVVQGCGLILRMDPQFEPAKKLMEKTRNPNAPIDVDALAEQLTADPMTEARKAMAARSFQRVVDITTEILTNDLMNEEARLLNEQAREKLEASPFVDQFVKKAEKAIAAGDINSARADLDKIKSLDADDTAIERLEKEISAAKPAAPSSSFVVETPPSPGGRGTAQASDFGFTFEEEKGGQAPSPFGSFSFDSPFSTDTGTTPSITPPPGFDAPQQPPQQPTGGGGAFSFDTPPPSPAFSGGFSFDAPPPAQPAKSPEGEFDFTTASIETSPDDQKKIQQYLADGDRAFDAGDFQGAIDLWSRVFLIDVTNDQASERIERAKKKRREAEQRSENLLASAVQMFDRGDRDGARDRFTQVLQLDPTNATANDYLGRLNQVPTEGGATGYSTQYIPPEGTPKADLFAAEPVTSGSYEAPLLPPSPASAAPVPAPVPIAARKPAAKPKPVAAPSQGSAMKAIVIVVVVAILGAGGWFAWTKFVSGPKYDPAATDAIFRSATSLAQKGQYDAAIAMLQEVKPTDPQHDKALQMMADLQQKKGQAAQSGNATSTAAYQEALVSGKAAYDAHDYDSAKKSFDIAARIKPLPPDMQALYQNASQQVAKLEGAKALFSEQRYQDALANLQSLQQQDPQNASIKRLITDAHFNLGAVALQEEKLDDASREFGEVLKLDPNDELAKRSKALAERYNGQPKDLLYKIYVKYLPLRKVASNASPLPAGPAMASAAAASVPPVVGPTIDCKEDFDCFIAASKGCSPARVQQTARMDIVGVKITSNVTEELRSGDANRCAFYIRLEHADAEFPPNTPAQTVDRMKAAYRAMAGREGNCTFKTSDLTEMLTRWKGGRMSTEDWKAGVCQGTYFSQKL